MRHLVRKTRYALRLLAVKEIRLGLERCPFCGPSVLIKFAASDLGVRCLRCRASATTLSLGAVLTHEVPDLERRHVYEMSSRGPLFRYLRSRCAALTFSEYFPDTPPGTLRNGVQCQTVEALTFDDEAFDVCTSTDVFEHVFDDEAGFREVFRVLKKGGLFVFTVPLRAEAKTIERARRVGDRIEHLLPPEYHDDYLSGVSRVLCVRQYGRDIVDRLRQAGFAEVEIIAPDRPFLWGETRPVILARKGV